MGVKLYLLPENKGWKNEGGREGGLGEVGKINLKGGGIGGDRNFQGPGY